MFNKTLHLKFSKLVRGNCDVWYANSFHSSLFSKILVLHKKNVRSIFIGHFTQFNIVAEFFLLIFIALKVFWKNWKKPPSNAHPAPAYLLSAGTFSMFFQDIIFYNPAKFRNYKIFFPNGPIFYFCCLKLAWTSSTWFTFILLN